MDEIGKIAIIVGILVVVGVLVWQFGGYILTPNELPGDITIEKDGANFRIPVIISLALSLLATLIVWFMIWIWRNY